MIPTIPPGRLSEAAAPPFFSHGRFSLVVPWHQSFRAGAAQRWEGSAHESAARSEGYGRYCASLTRA